MPLEDGEVTHMISEVEGVRFVVREPREVYELRKRTFRALALVRRVLIAARERKLPPVYLRTEREMLSFVEYSRAVSAVVCKQVAYIAERSSAPVVHEWGAAVDAADALSYEEASAAAAAEILLTP